MKTQDLVDFLNKVMALDAPAVRTLFAAVTPVSKALSVHPTLQTTPHPANRARRALQMVGLLNGALLEHGEPALEATYDDVKNELTGFKVWSPAAAKPEVKAEKRVYHKVTKGASLADAAAELEVANSSKTEKVVA